MSRWRTLSNTLIHCFYAERVGVTLGGATYAQAFNWLTCVRPYKGPTGLEWQEYIDQAYLITHIIFTLNNWGELMLDPMLLPHEYYFIRENMPIMITQGDSHLVGEFVECLRAFGCPDSDPVVRKGMDCLLNSQAQGELRGPFLFIYCTVCDFFLRAPAFTRRQLGF